MIRKISDKNFYSAALKLVDGTFGEATSIREHLRKLCNCTAKLDFQGKPPYKKIQDLLLEILEAVDDDGISSDNSGEDCKNTKSNIIKRNKD